MPLKSYVFALSVLLTASSVFGQVNGPTQPEATETYEPVPPRVTPGSDGAPPSDAIVLFNGKDFDHWVSTADSTAVKWHLNRDGSMTVKDKTGNIQTKQNFGSMQLHIEWKSPKEVQMSGQNRANSGVFLQGLYEVQVLDNNDNGTYVNGQVGSIYKQSVPLAMASVPSGEWNTYDIIYHAPKFSRGGNIVAPATITVLHNGVLIQDHFEIEGPSEYIGWPRYKSHGKRPLMLQDHRDNSRVSYRNIWVRELD
ncbi:3-keto-disaccharide hydrolase [Flagellimonas flava]|uniref:3-keto-disaccharide hydrolase n=1 Tax=Flagellimonas flava TaxID=570519 RepID=UPI003D64FA50